METPTTPAVIAPFATARFRYVVTKTAPYESLVWLHDEQYDKEGVFDVVTGKYKRGTLYLDPHQFFAAFDGYNKWFRNRS